MQKINMTQDLLWDYRLTQENKDKFAYLDRLAKAHFDRKEFKEAAEILDVPNLPQDSMLNLAKCFYYSKQAGKALQILQQIEKKDIDQWIDQALYHNAIGEHETSRQIYENILILNKDNPKAKFNMGFHLLREGDFVKGMEYVCSGSELGVWGNEKSLIDSGVLNPDKRLPYIGQVGVQKVAYVLEGGLGDEIIFLRWAKYMEEVLGYDVTVYCHPSLLRLLLNSGYDAEPIGSLKDAEYDAYIPAMSAPHILRLDIGSNNNGMSFPYIESYHDKFIDKMIRKTGEGRVKIGIKWFGNPEFEHDQFRTVPKAPLKEICSNYGKVFSLQFEDTDPTIPNCKSLINDFQDTYSVLKSLDIVVTSCTSIAHLAGAMGQKVFVMVPLVPYFVWANDDNVFYPKNVTVIRQTKYNDWNDAFETLEDELYKYCCHLAETKGK